MAERPPGKEPVPNYELEREFSDTEGHRTTDVLQPDPQLGTGGTRPAHRHAFTQGPGPSDPGGQPENWTNNPNEAGDPILQGIMMEGGGRAALGAGLQLLGRPMRAMAMRTSGGRARMALDEAGAPVQPAKGEFGQALKPRGTFNPEQAIQGVKGTVTEGLSGMPAGQALAVLNRLKSSATPGDVARIEEAIAQIESAATQMTPGAQRIADAQKALEYKLPHMHELGAAGGAAALLGHFGHKGMAFLPALTIAARNANPIAGRLMMDAPKLEPIAERLPTLLMQAFGAQPNTPGSIPHE